MNSLHDAEHRARLQERITSLRPDAGRQWGVMTIDQMLWHVNAALDLALGHEVAKSGKPPLPRPLMRFVVINLPWPKNSPTNPALVAKDRFDFERERARTSTLIDEMARKPLDADWGEHPLLGRMSGRQSSKLQAKHLDHHLRQFGS